MKLKMSDRSLFAILLRSPWWVSFALVAAFVLASSALLPTPYIAYGVMGGFPFFVIGVMAAWRQWRAPSPADVADVLARVGAMSWPDFSTAVENAYQRQGYATEACQAVIEYGFKEMGLPRLINGVVPENVASSRLCARLGFHQVPNLHPDGTGQVWILDNKMLDTQCAVA